MPQLTARSRRTSAGIDLPRTDGRARSARRLRDILAALESDLGRGPSEVEKALLQQLASLKLRGEQLQASMVRGEPVSADDLVRIANAISRVSGQLLGNESHRAPRPGNLPQSDDLESYLRKKAGSQ